MSATHFHFVKPRSTDEEDRLRPLISRLLTLLILAFAVLATFESISIVFQSYSPFIVGDQWDAVETLAEAHRHISWTQFWAQHNEHRVPVERLLCIADLEFFGGSNVSLLIEIFVVQLCNLLVFAWIAARYLAVSKTMLFSVLGFAAYCMFSPLQIENFIWGFQVGFVLPGLAVSICLASAIYYSHIPPERSWRRMGVLLVSLFSAIVAECSLANGLLAWPLLFIMAVKLQFRRRDRWIIAVVAIGMIALYLVGYRTPSNHSNPLETIRQPAQLLRYILTYFGSSWDSSLPNPSPWPTASELVTLIAIVAVLFGLIRCLWKKSGCAKGDLFLYGNAAFTLLSALLTALGRLGFGDGQAISRRYQSIALVFWTCVAMLVARRLRRSDWKATALFQLALVILLVSSGNRWESLKSYAMAREGAIAQGWNALVRHSFSDPAVHILFPNPTKLQSDYAFLESHALGAWPSLPTSVSVQPIHGPATISGSRVEAAGCQGNVDAVIWLSGHKFQVSGWAYDTKDSAPPAHVTFASQSGAVIGFARVDIARPDVPNALPSIRTANVGWMVHLDLTRDGEYRAFVVHPADKSACVLQNEVVVQNATE